MIKEKECTQCKKVKSISEFFKQKDCKYGLRPNCKVCENIRIMKYLHTKVGLVSRIYKSQVSGSKKRGHNKPEYTRQELQDWLFSKKLFHELFREWQVSGFDKMLSPSCDRLDDGLGYSLDRLQLITWGDNFYKAHADRKSGKLITTHVPVIGTHKVSKKVFNFVSIMQAKRQTGAGHIWECCKGLQMSSGGYTWMIKK